MADFGNQLRAVNRPKHARSAQGKGNSDSPRTGFNTTDAVKLIASMLLLAGLVWIANYGKKSNPIKYVRTEGVFQYLSKDEIRTALLPLVTTGFFDADMQAIHQAVAELTWVESVTVKRVWPDAIDIKIREKKPYVRWGQQRLLSVRGEIITPINIEPFKDLLLLQGPDQQQEKTMEIMKGVKTALADQSMEMVEFTINDRWAWTIKLTTGLEILLGRNDQLKRLQRFLKTLDVLGPEQVDKIAIVDLRYPNGYAVSWKPGTEPIDLKKIADPQHKRDG